MSILDFFRSKKVKDQTYESSDFRYGARLTEHELNSLFELQCCPDCFEPMEELHSVPTHLMCVSAVWTAHVFECKACGHKFCAPEGRLSAVRANL